VVMLLPKMVGSAAGSRYVQRPYRVRTFGVCCQKSGKHMAALRSNTSESAAWCVFPSDSGLKRERISLTTPVRRPS
jgi:hypothetical protein